MMKKIISILHSAYIVVIAIMLATSVCRQAYKYEFSSEVTWGIHTAVNIILILLAIAIVIAHFKKPSSVLNLQRIWWIPQLLLIHMWFFNPDKSVAKVQSLYHSPMGFHYGFQMGWEREESQYLFVTINVVAIVGFAIANIMMKTKRIIEQ